MATTLLFRVIGMFGTPLTQNLWGHMVHFVLSGFVLSGAINIQNQGKGHEYQFVLSGFLCYQVLLTYKIKARGMNIT